MCGRVFCRLNPKLVAKLLKISEEEVKFHFFKPSFNIGPSSHLITACKESTEKNYIVCEYKWGFELGFNRLTINAKKETLATKPTFKKLLSEGRVIVIVEGYFEWKKIENTRIPYVFRHKNEEPLFLAGLVKDGNLVIITENADQTISHIHDRMPVILTKDDADFWANNQNSTEDCIKKLYNHKMPITIENYRVSQKVNNIKNDMEICIKRDYTQKSSKQKTIISFFKVKDKPLSINNINSITESTEISTTQEISSLSDIPTTEFDDLGDYEIESQNSKSKLKIHENKEENINSYFAKEKSTKIQHTIN